MESIEVNNFIPYYPNTLEPHYAYEIAKKKEFLKHRLEIIDKSSEKGEGLLTDQQFMQNFFSDHTPYPHALLFHGVGTGKTCTESAIVEANLKKYPSLVFVANETLERNFANEISTTCVEDSELRFLAKKELDKDALKTARRRKNKLISENYQIVTFGTFFGKKYIGEWTEEKIKKIYSNRVIIIDEAHLIRQQDELNKEKGDSGETLYSKFHSFLHLVENCKILLMTGTPIWDNVDELASLFNLILPLDKQIEVEKFSSNYFNKNILKDDKKEELKELFRGKVSFLRPVITSAKREEIGVTKPWTEHVKIYPCGLSKTQSLALREAIKKDRETKNITQQNARDASNMVLPVPEGIVYGKDGFNKAVKFSAKKYSFIHEETRKKLLENTMEYSTKFAAILDFLEKNPKEVTFVFNQLVTGTGGVICLGLLLELHGYKWIKHAKDIEKGPKQFIVISTKEGTTNEKTEIEEMLKKINSKENKHGEYIQLVIGSKKIGTGITIKSVRQEFIVIPHWNMSMIDQAQARGFRYKSHDYLDEKERYIKIYRLASLFPGSSKKLEVGYPSNYNFSEEKTPDIHAYKIAEDKDYKNIQLYRLMKEASFNCALFYNRNVLPTDQKGSRECDYGECNYTCDFFPKKMINTKSKVWEYNIPVESIDYSTYNLFFSEKESKEIMEKIENIFKRVFFISFNDLFKAIGDKRNPVILLKCLDTMIESRVVIKNKYGFSCYIKEDNNIYYLSSNMHATQDYMEYIYSETPYITERTTFDGYLKLFNIEKDLDIIRRFCTSKDKTDFGQLEHETKIIFLEQAYIKKYLLKEDNEISDFVLDILGQYIYKIPLMETKDGINVEEKERIVHIMRKVEFKGLSYNILGKNIKNLNEVRLLDEKEKVWKEIPLHESKKLKQLDKINLTKVNEFIKKTSEYEEEEVATSPLGKYGIILDNTFILKDKNKKGKGMSCKSYSSNYLIDIVMKDLGGDKFENKKILPNNEKPIPEDLTFGINELKKILEGKTKLDFGDIANRYKATGNKEKDREIYDYLGRLLKLSGMKKNQLCEFIEDTFNVKGWVKHQ